MALGISYCWDMSENSCGDIALSILSKYGYEKSKLSKHVPQVQSEVVDFSKNVGCPTWLERIRLLTETAKTFYISQAVR